MRKEAIEIVVGVVLLSPDRGRERAQPTRGSATYSHFTEPQMAAKHGPDRLLCRADWFFWVSQSLMKLEQTSQTTDHKTTMHTHGTN